MNFSFVHTSDLDSRPLEIENNTHLQMIVDHLSSYHVCSYIP